jgi:hypothetical protein
LDVTAPPDSLRLFTVRIAGPGKTAWQVAVRAEDEAAAIAKLAERGHSVIGISIGYERPKVLRGARPPQKCANCGYDLRNLPVGEGKEITCPECGVVNGPVELPGLDAISQKRRRWRSIRLFAWGVAAAVIAGLFLFLLR